MSSTLAESVDGLPLVDHHCHGVTTTDLDAGGFDDLISEGGPAAEGMTNFDTPAGLAVRRHCAPLLDLPAHAPGLDYVARRRELGTAEVTRRLLSATGTARYCVDTGFRPQGLTTPAELAAVTGARAHEIVRLESVAEALAADGVEAEDFADSFARALGDEVASVAGVGVKSIAAYRVGLDLAPHRPSHAEVTVAASRWLAAHDAPRLGSDAAEPPWRLEDPVLTRELLWAAIDLGLPIQFHVGFGDADIRMHRADPSLLTDWLRLHRVPVMLLHCWPFHRQASYLAAVHPHVYLDVGETLHYVGPTRAVAVFAEAAELAPFGKLLYSSDAFGVPELYHLGALSFRRALTQLLEQRVGDNEWSATDAVRIGRMIGHDNAVRVYRLPQDPA
jgi:predicted TIM-barrel fold metal-dependent hydrolase